MVPQAAGVKVDGVEGEGELGRSGNSSVGSAPQPAANVRAAAASRRGVTREPLSSAAVPPGRLAAACSSGVSSMPTTTAGYLVRRVADAPTVPCPCGDSTRILTAADGAPASLHVTSIRDAERHYHRETTEVYYI